MILNKALRYRFCRPAGDDGEGGGGGEDRGDLLPESTPEDDAAKLAEKTASDKLEKELTDKKTEEEKAKGAKKEDDEPEETDEDKAARLAAEKKKDTRIPLSRHTEILKKERDARADLERQLAETRAGKTVAALNENIAAAEKEIVTLEAQYAKLLTDGKAEEAAKVMGQIRALDRQVGEAKSDFKIQVAEANAVERTRYNIALERVEESYPKLNPDHDDFDEELMGEVTELFQAYKGRGMTPTAALQKAVKLLVQPTTNAQKAAVDTKPRVTDEEAKKAKEEKEKGGKAEDDELAKAEKKVAELKAAKAAEARKKAAEAVNKTPASTAKVGVNSDALGGALDGKAVMKMSQDEFSKLPEAELAKLRGDEI